MKSSGGSSSRLMAASPRRTNGHVMAMSSVCRGESEDLVGRGLNAAIRRDFLEFYHVGYVLVGFKHEVYPVEWGARVGGWAANPIACSYVASALIWAPRDAGDDDVLTSFVRGMVAHPHKEPIDVGGDGALAVDEEPDLVGFVPHQLLLGFSARGESFNEELGQQGLKLGLGVDDTQATLSGWERQHVPLDFSAGGRNLATRNKIPDYPPGLATHLG
ncbi:unnamed protein product [Sphagnum troendelagicum]|uniref:Uncharacterized protein n=1 Tax=Sphagnum troendelagicum TaxID=128251 RepID=A0ABP0TVM8_9BRYO